MIMQDNLRKYALQNAVKFEGKANVGAVIGKVLSDNPDLKKDICKIKELAQKMVKEVNKIPLEEQKEQLKKIAPELLEKKKTEETVELPALPNAQKGKVITAFPPEPSGYPHIGHAKGAIVNYEYAKKYDGKFILRFEDTNPELARKEYYDAQLEGYKWLGVKWDQLIYISDTIDQMYKKAEELLKKGIFYACDCSIEEMRRKRMSGEECDCRSRETNENLKLFKTMQGGKLEKGEVIIRLKGDMNHKNSVMRDPTMFRVIKQPHDRVGTKYIVWPSYDFAAAFSDGSEGVTHRVRSKEFELRAELQNTLQKLMGFKETIIIEQARFNLAGVEASKRKIREKIATKELIGWDDPSLSTLVTLERRGFLPEAIKSFLLKKSITKHESTITWEDIEAEDRKFIDKLAHRYFFIWKPKEIKVENAPKQSIELDLHPDNKEGGRIFETKDSFYVTEEDYNSFKENKMYRLMDCLNFTKKGKKLIFDSLEYEKYKEKGERITHWLPKGDLMDVEVLMPNKTIITGIGEQTLRNVKINDVVQLERFGFCRLDKIENKKLFFWFTHK